MNNIDVNKTYDNKTIDPKPRKPTEKKIFEDLKLKKDSLRNWLKTPKNKNISLNTLTSLNKMKVGSNTKYGTLTKRRKKQISLALTFRKL
tara:strand:- start:808 stop:1077 length:270 start_codon:yes stop_codon:yes gene_type:complete